MRIKRCFMRTKSYSDIGPFALRQWHAMEPEHPIKEAMTFWAFRDCLDFVINETKVPYGAYQHRELVREYLKATPY